MAEEKKAKLTEKELDKVAGGTIQAGEPRGGLIYDKQMPEEPIVIGSYYINRDKTPQMKQQAKETAQRARGLADRKI